MMRRSHCGVPATTLSSSSSLTLVPTSTSTMLLLLSGSRRHYQASSFSSPSGEPVETVASRDIMESANSFQGKLMAPRTPAERSEGETSWRTMRAQEHFFEVPVRTRKLHEWQRAREDWYKVETKLIWTAFDAPEKIPMLLRDEVIRGHRDVFEDPKWLERALYWVKEARYWRVIGITKPFYDRDTLRAYAWSDNGQNFGQPVINSAMKDALKDLERARKRKDAGLDPNYIWDRWGPSGFVDGERSDYLPRFAKNPYVDPDGVEVEEDEIAAITSHEQIRDRYKDFIWGDEEPLANCFNTMSNGGLEIHDFGEEVRALYYELNLGPAPPEDASINEVERRRQDESRLVQSADDIRTLVYLSAQGEELEAKYDAWLSEKNDAASVQSSSDDDAPNNSNSNSRSSNTSRSWESFCQFLAPMREAVDERVDACRVLHWSCRDVDQAREFFQEKCGFVDFMMTSDKMLTVASLAQLKTIKDIASNDEWGTALCLALTDKEKADAIGIDAYAVWRELENLCVDRRRRLFTQRFTGPAHEEKTLDFLLSQFAKRPERTDADPMAMGMEFDREREPIGRSVQRRVLASDVVSAPSVQKKTGLGAGRFRSKKHAPDAYSSLRANQFTGFTRKF